MGLKFERVDDLDKLFESFAVDPKKKEKPEEETADKKKDQKEETEQ